jgi:two-component system, LuxR family, response regulator FixJ
MDRNHIFLVDNERTRRESLTSALAERGYELSAFDSGPSLLASPDYERIPETACLLTHLDLAPMTGIEVLDSIRADRITLPAVLIGATSELKLAVKAMRYGGTYILWRPFTASALCEVIENVLREWNETPGDESLKRESDALRMIEERVTSLSRRQRQVLRHVFEGNSNRAIADALGISVKTVELHRACMMKKMCVDSVGSLIRTMSDYRHALERCS